MQPSMKASLAVMVLACSLPLACTEDSPGDNNNDNNWFSVSIPQSAGRDVDLLFVVDNSSSMTDEFGFCVGVGLYDAFEGWPGELNLHVGVTSADLGAGPYTTIDSCEEVGGDRGILGMVGGFDQSELCIGPGQRYIVDVEPVDCTIEKDENGECISHSCAQTNCDAAARNNEVLTLAMDSDGCPRCRNYPADSTLPETSQCLGSLGFPGCGFSQPLEAMYQALDDTSQNTGFLREEAYLGIIFITDEDDCSVADPELFDPSQDSLDSPLGYLTTFRCFEFGVTCDINERTYYGLRQNCRPRDDPGALLHAISRYVQFLGELKDPEMLIIAALAGPVEDWNVTVGPDDENRPEVQECCTGRAGYPGPRPGIRLKAFVEIFAEQDAMVWAYQSIRDFCQVTLPGITGRIQGYILKCLPAPLAGCADVGVEFGSPQAGV